MTDVCLLNLAIADLLLVFSLPFLAHNARDQWVFGDPMCKIILGSYNIGFYSGIFFITLMSVDRYLAIVHAVYALKARTAIYGGIASVVTWIVSVLASFPEIMYITVNLEEEKSRCLPLYFENNKQPLRVFSVFKINVLGLLLPSVIMVFCYSMIIRRLLTSMSAKRHAIRLVLCVVMVFFFCWTPYNIACFFKGLQLLDIISSCPSSKKIILSLQITEMLAYSHSCLNPFIYVFVGEKFKRHLSRLVAGGPCKNFKILKKVFSVFKLNVLGLLLPSVIMVFCYSMIIRRLLTSMSAKRHAIRLVLCVVMVFFFCWTPYNIACFFEGLQLLNIGYSCTSSKILILSLQITETVAYSHSCLNPFIYVFVGEKFKRHLSRLVAGSICENCKILKIYLPLTANSVYSQSTSIGDHSTGL
ncbi:CCR4 protein, partial [Atractosteus spatula]|nr:CCR4 protein [Atractosteus spatula]